MGFLKSIRRALAKVQASPTAGLGRGFLVSIYQRLKEKVKAAYVVISGWIIDTSTGEVIEEIKPKYIGKALVSWIVDTLCADVLYEKPITIKGKVIRGLSVFGIIGTIAAGIVAIVGKGFSYLLYFKFVALLYAMILVVHLSFSIYSMSIEDRDISHVEPLGGQVSSVIGDTAAIEQTVIAEQDVADEETFDNEFFTSKEEEKKFHYELADFIRSKKLRPELAYYMFCHTGKVVNTRLDNEMTNFLMAPNNSEAVIKFIARYPKLSSSIMPNGYFDSKYSLSFNRYLLPIMFEPNSSLTLARYTKYFYRLVKI